MKNTEQRIIEIIDKLRPYLISDGGNIEFIKYEDNIVYITLTGNCEACPLIDVTLKDGIEQMITTEIPEVKEVCLYNRKDEDKKNED
jgi:Fe-S cluster biogenesis protein NfuA